MCELLGLSANSQTTVIRSFTTLAQRGGGTGPHKDGWGITFYEGYNGCRTFKDTKPSCCSAVSDFIQSNEIESNLVIAHIRQANRGEVTAANTHPFTRELFGRCWTMAHNGQLDADISLETGDFIPLGQTDSELAFCFILNELKKAFQSEPIDEAKMFRIIVEKARFLNQHGIFNMLLSDGRKFLAFCGSKLAWLHRSAPFGEVEYLEGKGSCDLTSVYDEKDKVTFVATQPVTNEPWVSMEPGDYALFENGECLSCKVESEYA